MRTPPSFLNTCPFVLWHSRKRLLKTAPSASGEDNTNAAQTFLGRIHWVGWTRLVLSVFRAEINLRRANAQRLTSLRRARQPLTDNLWQRSLTHCDCVAIFAPTLYTRSPTCLTATACARALSVFNIPPPLGGGGCRRQPGEGAFIPPAMSSVSSVTSCSFFLPLIHVSSVQIRG